MAAYLGVKHAVGVGTGFDALRLALAALGIGPGADVILPANTYVATAFAVSAVGARPWETTNARADHPVRLPWTAHRSADGARSRDSTARWSPTRFTRSVNS